MGFKSTVRLSALALAGLVATAPSALGAPVLQKPQGEGAPPAATQQGDAERRQQAYSKYLEGERLEAQGNFTQALEAYKQAVALAPEEDEPRVALARAYLSMGNFEEAKNVAQRALELKKDSLAAHAMLAEIYVRELVVSRGSNPETVNRAIAELEEVVRLDEKASIQIGNNSVKALLILADLYTNQRQKEKAIAALERLTKLDTNSSEAFLALARQYYSENKYREAARAADQALKIEDGNPGAQRILALSLLRSGRSSEAMKHFKSLLDSVDPTDPDSGEQRERIAIEYADALVQTGNYQDAIDLLKPIIAVDAKNVGAVSVLSDAHRRSGQRDKAVKVLEGALVGQDVSESIELVFELAETYEEMEQFDKAIETYEEALAVLLNPDGTVAEQDKRNAGVILRRIAVANRLGGNPERSVETYARMRKVLGADDPTPDFLEVQERLDTAQYDAAITLARKAGAVATNDEFKRNFRFLEAQALGRKGDLKGAVALLEGMLDGSRTDSDVHAFLAVVQLDGGDTVNAEKSIRKALAEEPNDTSLLLTLSSIQDRAGQFEASETTLRKVLKLDPDNATALNNLGYFLTERNERLDEALELIQRAVTIDPTNGSFLDSLGWLYFKMGNLPEAKRYLEQAATYEQQSATIREHLGDLYMKMGDPARARKYWEAALRLSNETDEIARLKDKLKE